jgi:hypothetical protein
VGAGYKYRSQIQVPGVNLNSVIGSTHSQCRSNAFLRCRSNGLEITVVGAGLRSRTQLRVASRSQVQVTGAGLKCRW